MSDKTIIIADPDHAGLPLALAFSEHRGVVGFDVDAG